MRLFDIISAELKTEKSKLEEELERVINNKDLDTNTKVFGVKNLINKISMKELEIKKWLSIIKDSKEEHGN